MDKQFRQRTSICIQTDICRMLKHPHKVYAPLRWLWRPSPMNLVSSFHGCTFPFLYKVIFPVDRIPDNLSFVSMILLKMLRLYDILLSQ